MISSQQNLVSDQNCHPVACRSVFVIVPTLGTYSVGPFFSVAHSLQGVWMLRDDLSNDVVGESGGDAQDEALQEAIV